MGRYIDWSDCTDRYPEIETLAGAAELGETYISYAEAHTEGLLAPFFTTPFSDNNVTVRDLCIDCVFWRAGRLKLDDAAAVQSEWYASIDMLKDGRLRMVDSSGEVLALSFGGGAYSTTQSYHSAFGMDCDLEWGVDVDLLQDEADRRD